MDESEGGGCSEFGEIGYPYILESPQLLCLVHYFLVQFLLRLQFCNQVVRHFPLEAG